SRGSESSPHGSPTPSGGPQGGSSEEIWVLRKPVAVDCPIGASLPPLLSFLARPGLSCSSPGHCFSA
ncbi:hypothetical protein NFI96_008886, partial [Prochilodus magdalenae]